MPIDSSRGKCANHGRTILSKPGMRLLKFWLLLAVSLSTSAANADEFIISYWCGPPPTEDLNRRYSEVAEAGFNYAMLPCSGASPAQNKAILDACKKNKLKFIPNDSRMLAFAPESPAFKTNLDAVISEYASHPALGGYFLADEPGPDAFPKLAAVNQYLLQRDPKRLPFVNLYPNYAPEWALGGTYEQHVEKYLTTVKPRLLSFDHYGLIADGKLRPMYFENLEIIRRQGLKHNVPFAFIFQVTPHFSYRDPTEAEIRWQANTALVYGARALLYFTYWSPTNDPAFKTSVAIIDPKGNRSAHYEQAKRVNAAVKAWAPTLMKLTSTAVYHTSKVPQGAKALPKEAVVHLEDGNSPFIVGCFRHFDDSDWVMIMNADMKKAATCKVEWSQAVRKLYEQPANGKRMLRKRLEAQQTTLTFEAGGARLFKIVH